MIAYTVMYNRPDLLGGQLNLLRKYCPEVSELRVANNGPDYVGNERELKRLGLTFLSTFPPPGTVTAEHHAHALNELWQAWGAWCDDDVLILDHDMFPFRRWSPRHWLADAHLAAHFFPEPPCRPWAALMAIRRDSPQRESLRFNPCHVSAVWCPTGGLVGDWVARNTAVRCHRLDIRNVPDSTWEVFDNCWLHHRDGSNWGGRDQRTEADRTAKLFAFVGEAMRGEANP